MPTLKRTEFKIPPSKLLETKTLRQGPFHAIYNLRGDWYRGEWKNGRKHGMGALFRSDGNRYHGIWAEDQKEGYGIWRRYNAKHGVMDVVYAGQWKGGAPHGTGTAFFSDGSYYEGDFVLGNRHGYGVMVFIDGRHYNGQWSGDKMEGFGIWTSRSGSFYRGEFRKGMFHGRGEFIMPEKHAILRGIWQDDDFFSGESVVANGKLQRDDKFEILY